MLCVLEDNILEDSQLTDKSNHLWEASLKFYLSPLGGDYSGVSPFPAIKFKSKTHYFWVHIFLPGKGMKRT